MKYCSNLIKGKNVAFNDNHVQIYHYNKTDSQSLKQIKSEKKQ